MSQMAVNSAKAICEWSQPLADHFDITPYRTGYPGIAGGAGQRWWWWGGGEMGGGWGWGNGGWGGEMGGGHEH